ncbi:DUF5696 domain-containing protein [Gorillibacterium sp. sgz500922]|uniref:DUF5696 domain-containing protein n=1 Tax=Gorillibacterium sp. sgz500922 TaxID=3446694 RepID=UPI003F671170
MKKLRYTLLAACLSLSVAAAGCSSSASKQTGGEPAVPALAPGAALAAAFTDSKVPGMKGVAESDRLKLFADETTGAIAVLQKSSGTVWYSNPPERDSDSLATGVNKDLLSAQLQIDFFNSFGQLTSMNSYSDSTAYKQIQATVIDGGVKVTYQFGTTKKSAEDLPPKLSKARFDEWNGKVDKTGQRALKIAYTLDPDSGLYERNDSALQGLQLDRALKAMEDAGYTEEDMKKDMAELNLTQTKSEARVFQASIEYTLDGDSLVAKVPVSDIHYPHAYPINSVSLLGFFGAGGTQTKGSMMVPDGSGALIHFNNGKTGYPPYQQLIYGKDQTQDTAEDSAREEEARLPIFGIAREDGAFLGIIEKGASVATIRADISGRLNSYNYVYPSFSFIAKDTVTLEANSQVRSLPKFQEDPVKSDFQVRYAFLDGPNAGYPDMARYYQNYLIQHQGLPERQNGTKAEDSPFYLQLVGSIDKKKRWMGIPYRALEPLTTFEQAQSIASEALERGIRNIRLNYTGWFNGGLDHQVPDRISVDSVIGGSGGLKNWIAFAQEHGISFFPDVSLLTAHSAKGFDVSKEAARTIKNAPAALYPINPVINRKDRFRTPSYAVSPRLVEGYTETVLGKLADYGIGGISLRDLADKLNSDYRKKHLIDRTESEGVSVQAFNQIRDRKLQVMGNGGNAYALPFLTDLTNAPLSNSGFKLEDEEIPFYPMVVRGYLDYTGAPFNLSTYPNEQSYVLKCLEYGANVSFEWIYEANDKVKDTEHDDLYSVHYRQWLDSAADLYRQVNEVLKQVQGQGLRSHEQLADGVFKTVYDNGIYVIVNYNTSPAEADGKRIEAESYITGGEQP